MQINESKRCKCLSSFDQTGIPVSLTLKKETVYTTRIGGVCSLIGMTILLMFSLATFIYWVTFDNYTQTVLQDYVDYS